MKLFFTYLGISASILVASWLLWWWSYSFEIVGTYQLGNLWRYWEKFNEAWAFASAFGAGYFLLLAVSKKENK